MPPCPDCGGEVDGPKGPTDKDRRDERAFKVYARRVKVGGGTTQPQIVMSVPAASAVDVFIRYRDDSGNVEDPFGSLEQWKIFAVNEHTRSQIGQLRTTGSVALANNDGVERQLFAIRSVPAESFDLEMLPTGVPAGSTAMFDVVIVAWGREPTGVGPFEEETFFDGDSNLTAATWVGQDQSLNTGVWRAPTFNQFTAWTVANGPLDGFTALDVAPVGIHRAAPPVLGDGDAVAFQLDASGNLKVAVASTTSSSQKFVSAAYEASHVSAGAKTMQSVYVSSKAAAAGFVFIFDAAALPANGTLPDFPPIPIPAGPSFVSADGLDRVMANGIVVAFSSTQATLTLATADCWFEGHF
jgi:hypothetical protein